MLRPVAGHHAFRCAPRPRLFWSQDQGRRNGRRGPVSRQRLSTMPRCRRHRHKERPIARRPAQKQALDPREDHQPDSPWRSEDAGLRRIRHRPGSRRVGRLSSCSTPASPSTRAAHQLSNVSFRAICVVFSPCCLVSRQNRHVAMSPVQIPSLTCEPHPD